MTVTACFLAVCLVLNFQFMYFCYTEFTGGFSFWWVGKEWKQPESDSLSSAELMLMCWFLSPLLSQSLTVAVVVFPPLRARLQQLREWDQSPGAEPVGVTAEALFPVLHLHRFGQPGRERGRVARGSVGRRGGSSGHCPCCCNWEKGRFRWQWWKWLSDYLNLKTISFKNDFWMNEQVNEELACVTIC